MKTFILFLLAVGLMFGQNTAKFPSAAATLQDLGVAKDAPNRSVLTGDMTISTLTATVSSGAAFSQYNIVIFADNGEQAMICSIATNTLTLCARGFGGTTAAAHLSGVGVLGVTTAWHHNQLAAEMIATHTALGVNLANVVRIAGSYTDPLWLTLTKAKVGLSAVENTALSGWAGSSNITAIGTLASGTVPWARLSNIPSSFAPATHAASHAGGAGDPITNLGPVTFTGTRVDFNSLGTQSGIHLSQDGTDSGLYLTSSLPSHWAISGGVAYNGTGWIGKQLAYSGISSANGNLGLYTGTVSNIGDAATMNPRLFIMNNGNVGIGLNNPSYQLQLTTDSAAKPTTSTWTVTSDSRVKTNIRPFTDGLDVLKRLRPVAYELNGKAGLPAGSTGIGLIAQEALPVAPYMIGTYKAKLNPDDETDSDVYNLNSSAMSWILTNAVVELEKQTVSPVFASDFEPPCMEFNRSQTRFVKDDVHGDHIKSCGRSADGTYAWKVIAQF